MRTRARARSHTRARTAQSHGGATVASCSQARRRPRRAWVGGGGTIRLKDEKQLESPFVVKLRSFFALAEPKPLFHFVHPNRDLSVDGAVDNNRFGSVFFEAQADGLVHGVAGYFESVLHAELLLSASAPCPPAHQRSCSDSRARAVPSP